MSATFTRKHYIEIARILHGVRDKAERQRLAEEFARMFRKDDKDDSYFDAERFSSAVYGEGVRETSRISGIRSYGPGKFYTILDSYAHEAAINGIDEEESYPDGGGWYGLLWLDDSARDAILDFVIDGKDKLTDEEYELLKKAKAIIFFERSDGIVKAEWFYNKKEAKEDWAKIQEEFEEMEGDE